MSFFYKSNLMEGFDSTLIPPKNDLEEKRILIEDTKNEANNNPQIQSASLGPVKYPYDNIIRLSHSFIMMAFFLFVAYYFATTMPENFKDNENYLLKYLDPCNSSTTITEFNRIKDEIYTIENNISSINTVIGFNISTLVNESLTQKLANLSLTFKKLEQTLQEQKDIRFACFKQNLEKRCEQKFESTKLINFHISVYIYLSIVAALLTNSLYFIWKAKKCELSYEQKAEFKGAFQCSIILIYFHVIVVIIYLYMPYLLPCNVERVLTEFPL